MKLIFLGEGNDALAINRFKKKSAGFIINTKYGNYHINPGIGVIESYHNNKLTPRETIAVITTNNKLINVAEVNSLIYSMTLSGADPFGVIAGPSSFINNLSSEIKKWVDKVLIYDSINKFGINYLTIKPLKINEEFDLLFEMEDLKVGFINSGYFNEKSKDFFKETNILIISCKHPKEIKEEGYFNSEEVLNIITKVKSKLYIITNFGGRLLEKDILETIRYLKKESKQEIIPAKEGLQINVLDYY